MQAQTFGDRSLLPETLPSELRLLFAEKFPLKWDECSSTANFLSQYYAGVLARKRSAAELLDATHSIAYLTNELLENTVKFRTPGEVEIRAGILDREFVLRINNLVSPETSTRFAGLLQELTTRDPGELLIARIESNAEQGITSGSGLGILTLMSDYGARLSWTFEPVANAENVRLQTTARLPLPTKHN